MPIKTYRLEFNILLNVMYYFGVNPSRQWQTTITSTAKCYAQNQQKTHNKTGKHKKQNRSS